MGYGEQKSLHGFKKISKTRATLALEEDLVTDDGFVEGFGGLEDGVGSFTNGEEQVLASRLSPPKPTSMDIEETGLHSGEPGTTHGPLLATMTSDIVGGDAQEQLPAEAGAVTPPLPAEEVAGDSGPLSATTAPLIAGEDEQEPVMAQHGAVKPAPQTKEPTDIGGHVIATTKPNIASGEKRALDHDSETETNKERPAKTARVNKQPVSTHTSFSDSTTTALDKINIEFYLTPLMDDLPVQLPPRNTRSYLSTLTREGFIAQIDHLRTAHIRFALRFGLNHTLYWKLSQRFESIGVRVISVLRILAKSGEKWTPGESREVDDPGVFQNFEAFRAIMHQPDGSELQPIPSDPNVLEVANLTPRDPTAVQSHYHARETFARRIEERHRHGYGPDNEMSRKLKAYDDRMMRRINLERNMEGM